MPLFPVIANHPETCVEDEPYNENRIKMLKGVLFDKTRVEYIDILGDVISMMLCL